MDQQGFDVVRVEVVEVEGHALLLQLGVNLVPHLGRDEAGELQSGPRLVEGHADVDPVAVGIARRRLHQRPQVLGAVRLRPPPAVGPRLRPAAARRRRPISSFRPASPGSFFFLRSTFPPYFSRMRVSLPFWRLVMLSCNPNTAASRTKMNSGGTRLNWASDNNGIICP
jgi:hypothetical protein